MWRMRFPGKDKRPDSGSFVAADDASRLRSEAAGLLEGALGIEWYEHVRNEVDRAALNLCRLRRAKAGERGSPRHGDEAVRQALTEASTPAVIWLASRAVSYMDENGFPEAAGPWFREDDLAAG
jgi:hypothetical protein